MLDRHWFGDVSRISPEAPVPVVKVEKSEERPGGAANVARNAAALGVQVSLLSVVGADEAGWRWGAFEREKVRTSLHLDAAISTTVKLRVIGRQQLLRIDFETTLPTRYCAPSWPSSKLLSDCDVVILSDYGKGRSLHIARNDPSRPCSGKRVLVDPKGDDYSKYAGATVIAQSFGVARSRWPLGQRRRSSARANRLRGELSLDALLVTRSEEGMTLFRDGAVFHEPARTRGHDVSGAGDTVIATLAVMMAAGKAGESPSILPILRAASSSANSVPRCLAMNQRCARCVPGLRNTTMHTIVTGAAGFIGSNIVKALNERGVDRIIAVDNMTGRQVQESR